MSFSLRRLPDAELEVMQAVWDCSGPATRTDIEKRLATARPLAPTTVLTLLSRLVERNYLSIEKNGRTNCYTPLITREAYLAGMGRRFWKQLCGGDIQTFVAALCHSGLSKEEIRELGQLLERGEL